ncbi:MAG: thermonuclease family protein [Myxococcota bacterium]
MHVRWVGLGLLLALSVPVGAGAAVTLVGQATVIDGDTLEIRGKRVRLHGVDAPESSQQCTTPSGKRWRCGQKAALALSKKIDRQNIRCSGKKSDRYGRLVAVCRVGDVNLNQWLVRRGWAVAYRPSSKDYVPDERVAKEAGRGVWSGTFVMPWEWRKGTR